MCTVRSPAFNRRRPGLCRKTMVKPVKFSRVWKEWRDRAASMRRGDTFDPWLDGAATIVHSSTIQKSGWDEEREAMYM
jgi:hypothetical protein